MTTVGTLRPVTPTSSDRPAPRRVRVLVVVTANPDERALAALPDLAGKEVRVLAPLARLSKLDWLANDDRREREAAERRAERVADSFAGDADPGIGADDVVLAVEDELRVFDADEIVLVGARGDQESWLESNAHEERLRRLGRPVRRVLTETDET